VGHDQPGREIVERSNLSTILQFLAFDAVQGPGNGIEASDLDLLAAGDAQSVLVILYSIEGVINPAQDIALSDSQLVAQVSNDCGKGAVAEIRRLFEGTFFFTLSRRLHEMKELFPLRQQLLAIPFALSLVH
jgi:hypothetical protein